jgi:hypothetical protein
MALTKKQDQKGHKLQDTSLGMYYSVDSLDSMGIVVLLNYSSRETLFPLYVTCT